MINEQDLDAWEYYNSVNTSWKKKESKTMISPMEMVKYYAIKSEQEPDPNLYERLIYEEYLEWTEARPMTAKGHVARVNKEHELKELADLVYVIYGYANAKGWDLDEAVYRVHSNNLQRMTQPDGTIKRREDGKIIKNPETPKVDLSDLV